MPIDVLLFDADDTLWDFQAAARTITRSVLDRGATVYPAIGELEVETVLGIRRELGRRNGQDDVVGLRRETFRLALERVEIIDHRLVDDLTEAFLVGMTRDLPLYPDTIAVLELLAARFTMAIVSNGTKGPEAGRIERYFRATVLGPIEGMSKPDPRLFQVALHRLGGVEPERALMIGDNDIYDVGGAVAAGIRAVLVDRRGTGSRDAAAIIHELSDLPDTIDRLAS